MNYIFIERDGTGYKRTFPFGKEKIESSFLYTLGILKHRSTIMKKVEAHHKTIEILTANKGVQIRIDKIPTKKVKLYKGEETVLDVNLF